MIIIHTIANPPNHCLDVKAMWLASCLMGSMWCVTSVFVFWWLLEINLNEHYRQKLGCSLSKPKYYPGELTRLLVRSLILLVSFLVYWAALSMVSWFRIFSMISSSSFTFSWYSRSICFRRPFNSFMRRVLSCNRTDGDKVQFHSFILTILILPSTQS